MQRVTRKVGAQLKSLPLQGEIPGGAAAGVLSKSARHPHVALSYTGCGKSFGPFRHFRKQMQLALLFATLGQIVMVDNNPHPSYFHSLYMNIFNCYDCFHTGARKMCNFWDVGHICHLPHIQNMRTERVQVAVG